MATWSISSLSLSWRGFHWMMFMTNGLRGTHAPIHYLKGYCRGIITALMFKPNPHKQGRNLPLPLRWFIWTAPCTEHNKQGFFLAPTEAGDITSTLAAGTRWFWNVDETVISFKQVKSKWQHSNCSVLIIKCTNSTQQNCRKDITNMLRNSSGRKVHGISQHEVD